jgi:heptosyltransferase-2
LNDPSRILVRCPNWVGDLVMATPALRALRARFPGAEITLLLKPALAEIVAGAPWHDRVVPLRTYGSDAAPGALLRAASALRRERYDLAILLPNAFSAAWLAKLARIPRILGYARNARSWLLSDRVPPPRERGRIVPVPMTRYYLDLVARLGCDTSRIDPELYVTPGEEAEAGAVLGRLGLDGARPLTLIMPGASFGSSKMWPPERFARAADALLARHGGAAAIFPGPGEVETAGQVAKAMRGRVAGAPVVGLGPLKAAVRRADLVLTNDAGARHLAAAFRVPHVVVMGPTDPRYTDLNLDHAVVVRRDVPCGPCHLKVCPLDHRCMTLIAAEDVVEAAERALVTRPRRSESGAPMGRLAGSAG